MKTYYLPMLQEKADYLQRLQYEVETRQSVIDRLFSNHKDDADDSVLTGVPFKTYHAQLEEAVFAFDLAKNEFTSELLPVVRDKEGTDEVNFDWSIEDFNSLQVKIVVRDASSSECGCCSK